jgi:shikimate kinase
MFDNRNIVLTGFMGTGKTTTGEILAARLQRRFVDMDAELTRHFGKPIAAVFAEDGEEAFRAAEALLCEQLAQQQNLVIATGGGAFVDPSTRAQILDRGIAVWIDCDIDTLVERTARRGNRPLLKNGNPREILTRLAAERAPFYGEAHIRVVSENGPHADTARAIIEAIDQWL